MNKDAISDAGLSKAREAFRNRFATTVPMIAILRGISPVQAPQVAGALIQTGITALEVPLTSDDALESIERIRHEFHDQVWLGAGTVLEPTQLVDCKNAGAEFIVSPDCNVSVVQQTVALGLSSLPGVLTPTEIFTALRAGATALKIFPAGIVGPSGIRALTAVLPQGVSLIPVGGIRPETLSEYWETGIRIFAAGSYVYKPDYSPDIIKSRASKLVSALRELEPER